MGIESNTSQGWSPVSELCMFIFREKELHIGRLVRTQVLGFYEESPTNRRLSEAHTAC